MAAAYAKYKKNLVFIAKFAVTLLAVRYLVYYATVYDMSGLLSAANPIIIAVAGMLSACGFLLQALFLSRLSERKLTFAESFKIEYYTLLMNLGIASSFFSLPKIALINDKAKDVKTSTKLFVSQMVFGICARIFFIVAAGALVFFGWGAMLATILICLCVSVGAYGFFRSRILPSPGFPGHSLSVNAGILIASVACVASSYFLVLLSLSVNPPIGGVVFSEGLAYLFGFFSPMPAGLGVREFALTELNQLMGISKDIAFAAAILCRFIAFSTQIVLGGIYILVNKRTPRPNVSELRA